ncbi:MAG TPA: amino acid adenylation domain-containing protein [Thermoanaerobaculia bacterium]|jgi:amino acid adenylation domain-containing protein|nr:amino acid adenylation domain-containing protein [Thermoanaerobaculia bacterium]
MLEPATLSALLRHRAQSHPGQGYTFLAEGDTAAAEMTFAELDRRARAIAAALRAEGAAGERVLLLYPQGLDFIAGFFGCLYAGAVAVPAYPPRLNRPDPRLSTIARDCRPRAVLTVEPVLARAAGIRAANPELADLCWLASDILSRGEGAAPEEDRGGVAFLQYTSGSTGAPKGVVVTHAHLLHNEEMIRRSFGQSAGSVVVGWLPLFHDMGLIGNVLQPLYSGGRCVLMSPVAFLQKPVRWLEAISRYGGTTSGGPDFAYALCARKIGPEQREGLDLSSWSVAYNGAEPVRAETLERFSEVFAPYGFRRQAFHPCYGLAEATLFVAGAAAGAGPRIETFAVAALERNVAAGGTGDGEEGRALVGCGTAWMDQEIAIVDPATAEALPPGRTGEVWVSGPSVAAGYWGQPEESVRVFGARLAGGRGPFLRTGDLGFLHDGTLFLTGRLKDLIILRGRNLYPQDLEVTAERSHPAFRPGCGAAFSVEQDGEERLVIVQEVEPRQRAAVEAGVAAEGIRRAVAEAHGVQAWEVVLAEAGAVPRTSSGKIRRRACRDAYLAGSLPVLACSRAALEAEGEALPAVADLLRLEEGERATVVTAWLRGLVALLARAPAGRLDPAASLVALGFDSIAATELRSRVEAALGVDVPVAGLLAGWTLQQLTAEVLAALGTPGVPATTTLPELRGRRDGRLTHGQKALWFLHRLAPESAAYNLAAAVRLPAGAPGGEELRRAFQSLAGRHPALRAAFPMEDGEPCMRVAAAAEVSWQEEDAADWSGEELAWRLADEAERPFDLSGGPLLRAHLFDRGGERVLLLAMHHIVSDFWSLAVLVAELDALCAPVPPSAPSPLLPPLPLTWADHAAREERLLAGPRGTELAAYWHGHLGGGLPVLDLPADRPRPPVQTYAGAVVRRRSAPALRERLATVARERGATPFMAHLAAYAALLQAHAGQDGLMIGSPSLGRTGPEMSGLVGYCVNPLALRLETAGDPPWSELLARVRRESLAAFAHQEYPFSLLAEHLQAERDPSRPPIFQTLFSEQRVPSTAPAGLTALALGVEGVRLGLRALSMESLALPVRVSQMDLSLAAGEVEGGLAFALCYNTDLFDAATAGRLAARFAALLEAVALDPERRLSSLALAAPAEREQVLFQWNDTAAPLAPDLRVEDLVRRQVERSAAAVAVSCGGEQITYGELWRRAGRLARRLRRLGVGPEVRVGVFLAPSLDLPAALLGVFRAGGAYVPLDLEYPAERLAAMLDDSRPAVVLTRRSWADRLPPAAAHRLFLEDLETDGEPAPEPRGAAESLAYVLYTSGSTGRPKGVQITHRSLANFLTTMAQRPGLGADGVVLAVTPLSFDIAGLELFLPWIVGGRVEIAPREAVADGRRLAQLLEQCDPTVMQATPSTWKMLLEAGWAGSGSLRILSGGEAMSRHLADRLSGLCGELWNLYGPTETTIWSCAERVGPGAGPVPIGRPVGNTRAYVLGPFLQPVPPGVAGQLFLGGDGLARGYLGRPDLTAGCFLPDAFSGVAGGRLYRTGDLVRFRPDGALEYLGRLDHQVKIRGFRIELGEIEAALRQHPAVGEAVAVAMSEADGASLAAFVVPAGDMAPPARELRDFLRQRLPEAMIPAAFVPLAALPLTHNGKLDRRRLPRPAFVRPATAAVAPRTPVEEVLAVVWAELLGVERVGVEDDFFELGGHSLKAAQLASRVLATFGVELPLRAFFLAPSVAGVAALIAEARGGEVPPIAPAGGERALSFGQQRLWLLDQLQPGGCAYNMPAAVRLTGGLDGAALSGAIAAIVRRHEVLRTVFPSRGGRPVPEVSAWLPPRLPLVDLAALPPPLGAAEAERLAAEEAGRPFDLAAAPPLRTALLRCAPHDHTLLLTVHHIAADAWSVGLFMRELAAFYRAALRGEDPVLPDLPIQYSDYAVWQRAAVAGAAGWEALAFWKRRLAGAPVLAPASGRPRPAVPSSRGAARRLALPAELAGRLAALARREGVTPFMVALAAKALLLARYSGAEDLVVGTPVAQRDRVETEGLIGFFVNSLVLRIDLAEVSDVRALLRGVRDAVLEAYERRLVPFERLVEELAPERGAGHNPLFQVAVAEQEELPAPDLPGLVARTVAVPNGTAKLDLSLFATLAGEMPAVAAEFSTDLWEAATVERLLGHCANLLAGIASGPQARVADLPLLGEEERRQLLAGCNETTVLFPEAGTCVHVLVERRAAETPQAPAVVDAGEMLTYGELDRRANRLARRLCRLGLGPEELAAIRMERSAGLVVAALAVLKAGGAYLPIDSAYPAERCAAMLRQSGARILLAGAGPVPEVAGVTVLGPAEIASALGQESAVPPAIEVGSHHLAYVIYTSGSTGRPKGVAVPHAGLTNLVAWHLRTWELGPRDRVAQTAGVGFDASVWEIWPCLATGAALHPVPADLLLSTAGLARWLAGHGITGCFLPTPLAEALLAEPRLTAGSAGLRFLLTGGDRLQRRPARPLPFALVNHYGPTESSVVATCGAVEVDGDAPPSIGRPIANVRIHLLDRGGRLAPGSVPGEVCIAGTGLARGYLREPDLTAAAFVPDPFGGPGERLYRTGDLARRLPAGDLAFLGRIDHQVKIRGFRIELGEIEAALLRHPAVAAAVAGVHDGETGRLVAWIVPRGEVAGSELAAFLAERLPAYMVPASWVCLPALPLTAHGKVDRRALPPPESGGPGGEAYVAPRSDLEEMLAAIWSDVLRVPRVGAFDDFFALGGHSLQVLHLVSRLRDELEIEISPGVLFRDPTLAGLSVAIAQALMQQVEAGSISEMFAEIDRP